LGIGTVYELLRWWGNDYDGDFMMAKFFEAGLEAGPFLMLQTYVVVIQEEYTFVSIISLAFTCLSLGYMALLINEEENDRFSVVLKNLHAGSYGVIILLCTIDVIMRTLSIVLLLKMVNSISWRICIAACFVLGYSTLVVFRYFDELGDRLFIFSLITTYPIMNNDYFELENICRGILTVAIFIFGYNKDVVNEGIFGVCITLTMLNIILSTWQICVRDDCKMIREKVNYFLRCRCCISIARQL